MDAKYHLKRLVNLEVVSPLDSNGVVLDLKIPPNSERVMLFRSCNYYHGNSGYAYEYNESYRMKANFTSEELKTLCKMNGKMTT